MLSNIWHICAPGRLTLSDYADFYSFAALLGDSAAGGAISAASLEKNSALQEKGNPRDDDGARLASSWRPRVGGGGDEEARNSAFDPAHAGAIDAKLLLAWSCRC